MSSSRKGCQQFNYEFPTTLLDQTTIFDVPDPFTCSSHSFYLRNPFYLMSAVSCNTLTKYKGHNFFMQGKKLKI